MIAAALLTVIGIFVGGLAVGVVVCGLLMWLVFTADETPVEKEGPKPFFHRCEFRSAHRPRNPGESVVVLHKRADGKKRQPLA